MSASDDGKKGGDELKLKIVAVEKPSDDINFIFGQTHFIKTMDDLHEALVGAVPGIKFGIGFCEASGPRLVRWSGTDDDMVTLAKENALRVGAGHTFFVFLKPPVFPVHVLNRIKEVPEVCRVFCATANPTQVVVAETEAGRGVMGVIDGGSPIGTETQEDIDDRRSFLKMIGYKC
jgi:uncharacterized protein